MYKRQEYCRETAGAAADALEISPQSVLICSTGVIGMQLPMEKMTEGVRMLAKAIKPGEEAGTDAAKAIMTTDTRNKQVAVKVTIGGKEVTIGGMCKGSGMIHPNMCTMLAFVTTDVNISKKLLQEALSADVQDLSLIHISAPSGMWQQTMWPGFCRIPGLRRCFATAQSHGSYITGIVRRHVSGKRRSFPPRRRRMRHGRLNG